jgi:hypothetical protein
MDEFEASRLLFPDIDPVQALGNLAPPGGNLSRVRPA